MTADPAEALHRYFGFREFLEGQEEVVSALANGSDALVVMPTGGGKSLCYQLPALVKDGVTLVVSPLIALMKDQVDALVQKKIPAAMINSTLTLEEQRDVLDRLRTGTLKLVYVAPERFRSSSFRKALQSVEISLFAVDEAHCLSQWGHDFRPDYLRLEQTLRELGHPQTAAFTATATPQVRDDILSTLKLRDPFVSVTGFERPNLSLAVREVASNKEKLQRLAKIAKKWRTGIVYCATRKSVEEVAEHLQSWGLAATAYHGGMPDELRQEAQNQFIDKSADIVVATNAFGMGIDRPDVRFVIHYQVPGSIEAYYQEAGRAGRDREPAVCELLFNYADTGTQEFFIDGNNPSIHTIRDVYHALRSHAGDNHEAVVPIKELSEWINAKNDMQVSSALSILVKSGYIARFDIPGKRTRGSRLLQPELEADELQLDERALAEKDKRDRDKLKAMIEYSYGRDCRQQWILRYFGEEDPAPCGSCDICRSEEGSAYRKPDDEEKLIVQKALSGVARMSRRTPCGWEARFGKGKIVFMLIGSRKAEILEGGFDQLSTYGLLEDLGHGYVNSLFREMEKGGLIATEKRDNYPLVTLTHRGVEAMKGDDSYKLNWPDRARLARSSKKSNAASLQLREVGFDADLFEKLRQKRNELAQAEGGKPAYTVFNNATLKNLTRLRPRTIEEGLLVDGVGEVKANRYLPDFLAIIRDHESRHLSS